MVTISTNNANDAVDMSDTSQYVFQGFANNLVTNFEWLAGPALANEININGNNLSYTGNANTAELVSGTITNIWIDVGNNINSNTTGDLTITGTEGLIAGNIKKGNARLFWNEILKGDDTFDLGGLGANAVGLTTNLIFGDDFSCPNFSTSHNDAGGNDIMLGANNNLVMIGDVFEVKGGQSERGGPIDISAQYIGGDDQLTSAATDLSVRLVGDATSVLEKGFVTGGDDLLDNGGTKAGGSFVAGDAMNILTLGSVTGGDDTIVTGANGAAAGDAYEMSGNNGFLQGGDDFISGEALVCAGDLRRIAAGTSGNALIGGDDRITGSSAADLVAGDLLLRDSVNNSVTGGDDEIKGGGGDDLLFGEVAVGSIDGVTGGNDRILGGGGHDQLFGQSGDDNLAGGAGADELSGGNGRDVLNGNAGRDELDGAAGNDRLRGGDGDDNFIFTPGSGKDSIRGFEDGDGAADDVIDVTGFGFSKLADIVKIASGDDLVLRLGVGDKITIVSYLASHVLADINNDILI